MSIISRREKYSVGEVSQRPMVYPMKSNTDQSMGSIRRPPAWGA